VERLVGFFALNRSANLIDELDALGRTELGDLAAQVKLIRAAWLLCDFDRQGEGRALAREALAERQHLFSPADVALAEAFAAEKVGQAIAALRRAVEADPLHYLAVSSLAVALAVVGDRDEAARQARFLRGVFPYSPTGDFVDAVLAFLEGDREGLNKALAKVAEKLPPDRQPAVQSLEEFLSAVGEVRDLTIRYSAGEELDLARAARLLQKAGQLGRLPNAAPLGLPVPAISLAFRRLLEIFAAYADMGQQVMKGPATPAQRLLDIISLGMRKPAQDMPTLLRRLEAFNDDYPDAAMLLMTAILHLRMSVDPVNRGDVAAAREQFEAAAKLCALAGKAPNIVPRSPINFLANGLGVLADLGVLKLVRQPEGVHLQRMREGLFVLVSQGGKWQKHRQALIEFCVQLTTAPLTREQCSDWNLSDPAGQAAFDKRKQDLAALVRALLDNWSIDEADNPAIPRLREALAKWAASSGIVEDRRGPPKKSSSGHHGQGPLSEERITTFRSA
jgi:hypothetical protein